MKTEEKEKRTYTIITGASRGLGKSFAQVCAQRKQNLILIALPNEFLNELSNELQQKYEVEVFFYEVDLTDSQQLNALLLYLKDFEIDLLINNAGVGGTRKFLDVNVEYLDAILLLNIRSLVVLTHRLLPKLMEQPKAYILNISSLAAFSPMPYKTVYPASKSFVRSFSRGLNAELNGTNVHVAVAHPGAMSTNEDATERIKKYKGLLKRSVLTSDEVANICIEKLVQKKEVIVPGRLNGFFAFMQRILPFEFQSGIMRRKLEKEV